MTVYSQVETFLQHHCPDSRPVLLALSGGPDSICLFHCLLTYHSRYRLPFHVAHVDHGWRVESRDEAFALRQLAADFQVPFHSKTLDPSLLKGNLEAACRKERYAFFADLAQEIQFQAILTGHHQDDQAETICKRILEGAHWSRWTGLLGESKQMDLRILRPLLTVPKSDIKQFITEHTITAFDDPTNQNTAFLRARLRTKIFPWLNEHFRKDVRNSFLMASADAKELVDYFEEKTSPFLRLLEEGPWGSCLNFQSGLPNSLLEIKYIIRRLSSKQQFFLSREIIEGIAGALLDRNASKIFNMGPHQIRVDRQRLFFLRSELPRFFTEQQLCVGGQEFDGWKLDVREEIYSSDSKHTSWEDGWKGRFIGYLPISVHYSLKMKQEGTLNVAGMKKKWSQSKVPLFLTGFFPFIYRENDIYYEFLVGKPLEGLQYGVNCWKIEIYKSIAQKT